MKKKAIIIIISLLVILAGTGAILWFCTPVFDFLKPSNDNFSIQAKKLFGVNKEMSYDEYMDNLNAIKNRTSKSYTSKSTITANVSLPSSVLDYQTQKTINNTTIKMTQSYDEDSKAISEGVSILYDNKNMLDATVAKEGKKITLSSKDFYDKALIFDIDKFKAYCKANAPELSDETIDRIISRYDTPVMDEISGLVYDLFYLTEDEYNSLKKDYGDVLKKFISADNFTTKKNQKVTVDGKEVKTTAYSLTISGKDVYKFIKDLAEDAKDNDNLKGIVAKKLNIAKELIGKVAKTGGSELSGLEELLEKDFAASDVEEFIGQFIDAFETSEIEDAFSEIKRSVKITIYTNKKSEPVKLDVAIVKNKDDDGHVFFTEEISSKKVTYTLDIKEAAKGISGVIGSDIDEDEIPYEKIILVNEIDEYNDTTKKGTLKLYIKADGEKSELGSMDYEIVSSKSEAKFILKIKSSAIGNASAEIKIISTGLDTDNAKSEYSLDVAVAAYKVKVNMESEVEFGKANIEKYDDSNSVDVFSKSKEETEQIFSAIIKNAADILPERLANFGIKVTKQEILDMLPTQPTIVEPVAGNEAA